MDENGNPVPASDPATFSNVDPNTSEADAFGGSSSRIIWGTSISISDTMSKFKDFLNNFQRKYRMWAEGATEEQTSEPENRGDDREYVEMLQNMRQLGLQSFHLDVRNLKAYPPTVKLYHQLHSYPHEVIPFMDQCVKDLIVDQAEEEMNKLRVEQRANRAQSSVPPMPR